MNKTSIEAIAHCKNWLKNDVLPLWTKNGIDKNNGSFFESLKDDGSPDLGPRRALVQCRQIYAISEAYKMQLIEKLDALKIITEAVHFLNQFYRKSDGKYIHAVDGEGHVSESQSELYTQAFVLFALARSYELLKSPTIKETALELLSYLYSSRHLAQGGFSELKNNVLLFQSNPHMHLFEAAIEWIKVDSGPEWKKLGQELFILVTEKFINSKSGFLAEHFDEDWKPCLENSNFVAEPGHHYEWSWLLIQFEKCTAISAGSIPQKLYELAEVHGVEKNTGLVYDEITSGFDVKKKSHRFWPQCERIKTALELGLKAPISEQPLFAASADEALQCLFQYLHTETPGLWKDTILENGQFTVQAAKASSLYHIINAMSEYCGKRPLLQDKLNK